MPTASAGSAVPPSDAAESARPAPRAVHRAAAAAAWEPPRGPAPLAAVVLRRVHAASPAPTRAVGTARSLRPPVAADPAKTDGPARTRYSPRPYRWGRVHSLAACTQCADLAVP